MNKLARLELKRNSLKPYHIAVSIISVVIFSFLYLLAVIPRMDAEMFMSYDFIVGLDNIVSMAIFSVMSAAMASKFISTMPGYDRYRSGIELYIVYALLFAIGRAVRDYFPLVWI